MTRPLEDDNSAHTSSAKKKGLYKKTNGKWVLETPRREGKVIRHTVKGNDDFLVSSSSHTNGSNEEQLRAAMSVFESNIQRNIEYTEKYGLDSNMYLSSIAQNPRKASSTRRMVPKSEQTVRSKSLFRQISSVKTVPNCESDTATVSTTRTSLTSHEEDITRNSARRGFHIDPLSETEESQGDFDNDSFCASNDFDFDNEDWESPTEVDAKQKREDLGGRRPKAAKNTGMQPKARSQRSSTGCSKYCDDAKVPIRPMNADKRSSKVEGGDLRSEMKREESLRSISSSTVNRRESMGGGLKNMIMSASSASDSLHDSIREEDESTHSSATARKGLYKKVNGRWVKGAHKDDDSNTASNKTDRSSRTTRLPVRSFEASVRGSRFIDAMESKPHARNDTQTNEKIQLKKPTASVVKDSDQERLHRTNDKNRDRHKTSTRTGTSLDKSRRKPGSERSTRDVTCSGIENCNESFSSFQKSFSSLSESFSSLQLDAYEPNNEDGLSKEEWVSLKCGNILGR